MRRQFCDFCNELENKDNSFSSIYCDRLPSRVLLQTPNFVIIPSIGQLAFGHLLVVSKVHYTAVAQLATKELDELSKLIARIRETNKEHFGTSTIVFEHGVARSHGGGCGIEHLHVHVLPLAEEVPIMAEVSKGLAFAAISSLREVANLKAPHGYVFLQDQHGQSFAAQAPNLPSQYMRRAIGNALGIPNWDWRQQGIEADLVSTYECYSPLLSGPECQTMPNSVVGYRPSTVET